MGEQVFYNTCPAAGCHQYCALKVLVEDGKIHKVESADYPGNPAARCICVRGLSSAQVVYHPDRLKYPLKRIGERGEGKWKRISWDEALDTIANKLMELKKKYGPESLKVQPGGSSNVGLIGMSVGSRFANVWGAGGAFTCGLWSSDGGIPAASLIILGVGWQGHDIQDFIHSKMIILWGWNPAETALWDMKCILDAKDKGAKLVVIGPMFDATAAKADQWIPIRPGTDAALALGMMNVIMEEGHYDKDYVAKYTVGPFLVRDDNKLFLRDDGKCLVWDEKADAPKPHDLTNSPALLGSFTVKGVRCKPAFQLLMERVSQYNPEKAASITGVPAETIRRLALEYAASKPAAIKMSHGLARTLNSNLGCRNAIILAAITGNIGIQGGGASTTQTGDGVSPPFPAVLNNREIMFPAGAPGTKTIPGTTNYMKGWAAIRDGKPYPIKALIISFQNPLQASGHIDGYREIFSQLELVVVIDIFMTRTARYADIVLPDTTIFERDDISLSGDYLIKMEKAIEPLHQSKPAVEIWSELAQRLGLGKYFEYTMQDYMKIFLDSKHPYAAGITLERLEKEKIVRANKPLASTIAFPNKEFPTPSGKVEFYQERLIELGEELPVHKEQLESPRTSALAKNYPLTLLTVKDRTFTQTQMANIGWLREINPEPMLDINSVDAQGRGIKDNDTVLVFNDRGRVKLRARLNEAVPPGTVNIDHGWWPEQFAEGHYNDLDHRVDDLSTVIPSLDMEPVTKDFFATAHLIPWDCLVEVKKF